ncbi:MAG: hypothetical protein JO270_05940 [Acidobacteriaceae bacterium]|nr:hypothetical protein [Acidobacteriaceae bacterium]
MPELVKFYRLIEEVRPPMRADGSVFGMIPTRAFQFCHPLRTASSFGYYVFPAMDFYVVWDSQDNSIWWYQDEEGPRYLLSDPLQYPGQEHAFNAAAPDDLKGWSIPWIEALPEPGYLQIWSGLIAWTRPGTSLLVRPPANHPRGPGFEAFEGIVETDVWFGPLFTNVRLLRTDRPIAFRRDVPIAQVQPIPRDVYSNESLKRMSVVSSLRDFSEEDWQAYRESVIKPSRDPGRPHGAYAVKARKRRAGECPFAAKRETSEIVFAN